MLRLGHTVLTPWGGSAGHLALCCHLSPSHGAPARSDPASNPVSSVKWPWNKSPSCLLTYPQGHTSCPNRIFFLLPHLCHVWDLALPSSVRNISNVCQGHIMGEGAQGHLASSPATVPHRWSSSPKSREGVPHCWDLKVHVLAGVTTCLHGFHTIHLWGPTEQVRSLLHRTALKKFQAQSVISQRSVPSQHLSSLHITLFTPSFPGQPPPHTLSMWKWWFRCGLWAQGLGR